MEAKRRDVVKTVNEQEDKHCRKKLREQDEAYTQPLGERALKIFPKVMRN
jgi:hypothetical protein